jgi:hypothetical protein
MPSALPLTGRGRPSAVREEIMSRFEYHVTKHPADAFRSLAYFCSEQGECGFDEIPTDEMGVLRDILNEQGGLGWDLVQLIFEREGMVAVWKRPLSI